MKILRYKIDPSLPDWLVDYTWEKIVVPLYENNYITTLNPTSAKDFPTICPDSPEHYPRIVPHMIGQMLHEIMRQACRNKLDIPIDLVDSDMFITIDEQTALIEYMKNC
jgi:hypothetical protein